MKLSQNDRKLFELRMNRSRDDLFGMLDRLYGQHGDYGDFCAALEERLLEMWSKRPAALKWRDMERDLEPDWFQRPEMNGYVFYIDRFAHDLKGVQDKLDYLADLGITYVHFMPCLLPRPGDSDGGYSVMDYRRINPAYGTMAEFEETVALLHDRGISVCIDMVLNHTAKEHEWAEKARAGEARYQSYYLMYDDDRLPKQYERTLIEIFPEHAPGSFTWYDDLRKWVWTTFNEHQWDLNWANPWVFLEMTEVMLNLANKGVDVLRFDAVAFMWKRMGTRCQSEPEVHMLLQALRAASRIAAPSVIHLEEAIVSPQEMIPYLGKGEHTGKEGNLAYHNSLMVQFWSALAARDTRLMTHVLGSHFPPVLKNATYVTYTSCHDDIGWAITDQDAAAIGFHGQAHRAFLSDFYEGVFPGSFARGELFQFNPDTGDKRISGMMASMAGLERALGDHDRHGIDLAIDRILLGFALIASYGGIPLVYMGTEIAMLNDYDYRHHPDHAHDSRWVHRPRMNWQAVERLGDEGPATWVHDGVRHILTRRAETPELHAGNATQVLDTGDAALFAFARRAPTGPLICLFNFTELWQNLPADWLRAQGATQLYDVLSGQAIEASDGWVKLPPYARVWAR